MPRVLQLSPRVPLPLDDGGRIATWNYARCLQHNGYAIDLVCFTPDARAVDPHRSELARVFATVGTVTRDVERQYPAILLRALLTGSSYFTREYYSSDLAALVRARLDTHVYDATIIDSAYMGVYASALRAFGPAAGRIVLREHNVEHELLGRLAAGASNPFYRVLLRREARLFRRHELDLVERVDDVRMISARDAEVMRACGVEVPVGLLPPFIDVERYTPEAGGAVEPGAVVCVGNMAWMPNANGVRWFCNEVWPRVVRERPDAKFYIVGKNPPPAVSRLAGPRVEVTGYVEDERPWIGRAHLFVVPLLEGSGIRIKILTALAMGRPVLSTTVGAEGIDYPRLTRCDDASAWVPAITGALSRPPATDEDAVRYVRDHYSWRRAERLEPTIAGALA